MKFQTTTNSSNPTEKWLASRSEATYDSITVCQTLGLHPDCPPVQWARAEISYAGENSGINNIIEHAGDYDGQVVSVEGRILTVKYRPDIRNGFTTYSFEMSDDSNLPVRIISPMAAIFSTGDAVRVSGIFHKPNEIDATDGTIEVLEGGDSELSKILNHDPKRPRSVPVSPLDTPWTRSDQISSILSALFALFGVIALSLRLRRFNLGLSLSVVSATFLDKRGDSVGEMRLVLLAISTRSLVPLVADAATLRIAGRQFNAISLRSRHATNDRPPIPVVEPLILELKFNLSRSNTERAKKSGGKVILRDTLCRKKFVGHIGPETAIKWEEPIPITKRKEPEPTITKEPNEGNVRSKLTSDLGAMHGQYDSRLTRGLSRIFFALLILIVIYLAKVDLRSR